jgi:hypothetical protein
VYRTLSGLAIAMDIPGMCPAEAISCTMAMTRPAGSPPCCPPASGFGL